MKYWVGTTDYDWFRYLSATQNDEVNFWQPSGQVPYVGLVLGSLFLFKLKRPFNHIAGGGYFVKSSSLPMSMVWEAFGRKNGATDWSAFSKMIRGLTRCADKQDPEIGCTVLASPFFWPKELWIEDPAGWSGSIVRGRYYDTDVAEGARLWEEVRLRFLDKIVAASDSDRFGAPILVNPRLGQGAFRIAVTDAYARRCAITGETTLPVLEAGHILPYAENGPHEVSNGLLLRSDFHRLFDLGLVTVTPDLSIVVSDRIRDEWFNGKAYYRLNGHKLSSVPQELGQRPSPALLQWHNENRFRG